MVLIKHLIFQWCHSTGEKTVTEQCMADQSDENMKNINGGISVWWKYISLSISKRRTATREEANAPSFLLRKENSGKRNGFRKENITIEREEESEGRIEKAACAASARLPASPALILLSAAKRHLKKMPWKRRRKAIILSAESSPYIRYVTMSSSRHHDGVSLRHLYGINGRKHRSLNQKIFKKISKMTSKQKILVVASG